MRISILLALVLWIGLAGRVHAAEPLVDAAWAIANLRTPGIIFLDVQSERNYERRHVVGAVHTLYPEAGWRTLEDDGRITLPTPEEFAEIMSGLGIDNDTHVVIVATGSSDRDMAVATDVYWTFKFFAHDEVSILNGGLNAFRAARGPVDAQVPRRAKTQYEAKRPIARLRATYDDVFASLGVSDIIDHRPVGHFLGLNRSSYVRRPGTIPGAKNLPTDWLMRDGAGVFRTPQELLRVLNHAQVPPQGRLINIADASLEASLGWFVSYELLNNKAARLYVGGFSEWTARPTSPMVRRVNVDN